MCTTFGFSAALASVVRARPNAVATIHLLTFSFFTIRTPFKSILETAVVLVQRPRTSP